MRMECGGAPPLFLGEARLPPYAQAESRDIRGFFLPSVLNLFTPSHPRYKIHRGEIHAAIVIIK